MAAYVISDLEILDNGQIEEYRSLAAASIAQYGGRYIVRGGAIEPIEGHWMPKGIVIVEFPNMERAREWYRSPEAASPPTGGRGICQGPENPPDSARQAVDFRRGRSRRRVRSSKLFTERANFSPEIVKPDPFEG